MKTKSYTPIGGSSLMKLKKLIKATLLIPALLLSAQAQANGTLFLVNDDSPNELYTVNTTTGVPTLVGLGNSAGSEGLALSDDPTTLLYGVDGDDITTIATDGSSATTTAINPIGDRGLTFNATTGLLYGSDNSTFQSIDPNTGTITTLTTAAGSNDIEGLAADSANNVIYGLDNDEDLYVYNVATDTWSLVGNTGVADGNDNGLAFDPIANLLYAVGGDGNLYRINPTTAATVFIADTNLGSTDYGLAFLPAQGVPTLSVWGLLALTALLGVFGTTRRRTLDKS